MDVHGGNHRVVIEGVTPEIDGGRFRAKRIVGDEVIIEADLFADGHDVISAVLRYCAPGGDWEEVRMAALPNDRWRASFVVSSLGIWRYGIEGWIDHFKTWRRDFRKRAAAGDDLAVHRQIGASIVSRRLREMPEEERPSVEHLHRVLSDDSTTIDSLLRTLDETAPLLDRYSDRSLATRYDRVLELTVERDRARFSSWYELFPRSARGNGEHGTLRDVIKQLPYISEMGFDILYLPPIHPIGEQFRKGKNNAVSAEKGDVGSPWAVGGTSGGHTAIHPDLGSDADFDELAREAAALDIELALDIAFQAAPDHPLVKEHPEYFLWRPDQTVQYAENPPKKYQDIYPFHFEGEAWQELWQELRSIVAHWIERGVRVFRIDNPHTKPLGFWQWMIESIRGEHPDVIFLAEAFTRPKVMYYLAKSGFSQGYTYFTWRTTKQELSEYMRQLTATEVREYFRPNFWPNTPDILPEHLQSGERAMFILRLVLAATLSSSYGIYGPAYELMEHQPREAGGEEYLHSEKYEIRQWNLDDPKSLRPLIARVNRIRREQKALQANERFVLHATDNDQLFAFSKTSSDGENSIVVVANLDPYQKQSGFLELDADALALLDDAPFQMHDLLSGARFSWTGRRNFIQLNPSVVPAHIFQLRRRMRRETDFDYYF